MAPSYRVELASSNRAGCQNTECKKAGAKISKGELRFGTWVVIEERGSYRWKHWGCTTPVQLTTWWDLAEQDIDLIDGYDELSEDLQEKVKRALQQGHVDDSDWNGDVEKNRPGQKGFRVPTPKAKKVNKPNDDSGDAPGQSETPTKAAGKKRSRAKKENDDIDDDAEPLPKKAQKKSKKQSIKEEEDDDAAAEAAPAPKKRKVSKKTDDVEDAPKPVANGKAKKSTAAAAFSAPDDAEDVKENSKPASKAKSKKKSAVKSEDLHVEAPEPKPQGRKNKTGAAPKSTVAAIADKKPAKGRKKKSASA